MPKQSNYDRSSQIRKPLLQTQYSICCLILQKPEVCQIENN